MNQTRATGKEPEITPQEGKEELRCSYETWSAAVGSRGIQATYAIIAANWAVHSSAGKVLGNIYATISVGLCIGFLLIDLLFTELMTERIHYRWQRAEDTPDWWNREWRERATSKWPFTDGIENLALCLRYLKTYSPIMAGLFFIWSLFAA